MAGNTGHLFNAAKGREMATVGDARTAHRIKRALSYHRALLLASADEESIRHAGAIAALEALASEIAQDHRNPSTFLKQCGVVS